ncbi:DUF3387 domain-containing protein [Streptomyces sp. NBC_01210]|uniref:hypothetical protein n=1 Tax=Streptomyces sp. NBC_01210 TaxID=2903774 RepID=UPI002E0E4CFA|nr:DUF3387 domain-containing protein [Streptomyces sp. NBC_01210]
MGLADYDAVADHGTAPSVMGDEADIARELVAEVHDAFIVESFAGGRIRGRRRLRCDGCARPARGT